MRKGYIQWEDGEFEEGYWHDAKVNEGDLFKKRNGEWAVLTSVEDAYGPDGCNWFCQLRDATADEIEAHTTSPVLSDSEREEAMAATLERIAYIGS